MASHDLDGLRAAPLRVRIRPVSRTDGLALGARSVEMRVDDRKELQSGRVVAGPSSPVRSAPHARQGVAHPRRALLGRGARVVINAGGDGAALIRLSS